MASVTKYPGTVSQTTGGHYVPFDNLSNIRSSASGSWAVSTILIQGKSETKNRPSSVSATNFGFQLPEGAEPTKITVRYRHIKQKGSDYTSKNKHMLNIPAPTISLLNAGGQTKKGVAPATSSDTATHTVTFDVTGTLSRAQVNNKAFGFKLNYPANANAYNGYIILSYVNITLEYKTSSYSLGIKKASGGYNKEDFVVNCNISNKNLTRFNPNITITSPVGFTFKEAKEGGTVTKVNERTFRWNADLGGSGGSARGSASVYLVFVPDVSFPSGVDTYTGVFTIGESLNGTSKSFTAVITERPPSETPSESEETEPNAPLPDAGTAPVEEQIVINVIESNDFILNIDEIVREYSNATVVNVEFPRSLYQQITYNVINKGIRAENGLFFLFKSNLFPIDKYWNIRSVGKFPCKIYINESGTPLTSRQIYINVMPEESDLTIPFFSILEPSEEEYDRLGTGYTYMVQSYIKHTTEDETVRDWYKNNRIGVFNNPIKDNITIEEVIDEETGEIIDEIITDTTDYQNLTMQEIFDNAEYWSENTAGLNTYENVECEFPYNENYPLYIIFTGDYPEVATYGFDIGSINYTNPCIMENYRQYTPTGIYPVSINDLIGNNGGAELTIEYGTQTDPIILYDLPLDEHYGTTEELSVRGITVSADIEYADEQVIYAKLKSPTGAIGQRSVVIDNKDNLKGLNELVIGGMGDLWGFNTPDLVDLEDWELEIVASNILGDSSANLNIGNFTITFYMETIDKQDIVCKIEGENIAFYGAFLEEANIPEGLETDTSFLSIDGTDTNNAYRQNIRQKTIELEVSIEGCDLKTTTDMLRQFTKLIQNEKDQYNRPIPKRIEFSHYPDVYWEYILKEAMDVSNEGGDYIVKAKLVVPSGTSYDKESTVTNATGFVQGLASINPIITLKPNSDTIQVTETVSGQKFHIAYGGDWENKIVLINCDDRQVLLMTDEDDTNPLDISQSVDRNSDWFSLHGEFIFETNNCTLRTVEYTERW